MAYGADGRGETPLTQYLVDDQLATLVGKVAEQELRDEVVLYGVLRHGATLAR